MDSKICTKCAEQRPLSAFNCLRPGALRPDCKVCQSARNKAYRGKNSDRIKLDKHLKYVALDRGELRAKGRSYYEANAERIKARQRDYYRVNTDAVRERNRESQRKHYRNNAEAYAVKANARCAHKRGSTPAWADTTAILSLYRRARELRVLGVDCHVDHVIPLQGRLVSGLHVHNNLEIVLASENRAKGNYFSVE